MKVILMKDVLHAGKRGEVLDVKPGYARNYLIPQGWAREATAGNLKLFEQQKENIDARHEQEVEAAKEMAAQLDGLQITVSKRVGETETLYGSVTATDVAEALEAQGIEVDKRRIDLEGGIKTIGTHEVRIDLHPDVTTEISVNVIPEE